MAGKVVNSSFLLLSKFGASRQESTSKTATSHIRKPFHRINKSWENQRPEKGDLTLLAKPHVKHECKSKNAERESLI